MGFDVRWLGTAPDSVDEIRALLEEGLRTCDAVLSTGGVSVGDYDVTAKAMEEAGAGILFRGVSMKPGMACAYGVWEGKLVCGLSGNPASSLINFHVIAAPAFRRIAGWAADRTLPSLILFDSLDGKVHPGEEKNPNLLYFEYARIRMDGQIVEGGTRKVEVTRGHMSADSEISGYHREKETGQYYEVSAVRYKDHALVRILSGDQTIQVILALPDSSRFLYVSVGGEKCFIHNIMVENEETEIGEDTIPRIAEEISFIKGCPQGDVPNIQVDGWRTEASEGIPVTDHMALSFHTMSLPTARLVWHCAFISVFSSADGRVNGRGFREYILLRLDGENWGSDEHVENNVVVEKRPDFVGWDEWKERNKQGLDCVVTIRREKNQITMQTENLGISIHSTTTILDNVQNVYVALTGDQCAITDIRCS